MANSLRFSLKFAGPGALGAAFAPGAPLATPFTRDRKGKRTMISRAWLGLSTLLFLPLALTTGGCGGSDPSSVYDGGSGDSSSGHSDGGGSDGQRISLEGGSGGDGAEDTAACATDRQSAKPTPAYLVFLLDRSDSMSQDSKWTSASTALDNFFASKSTAALSASLTLLPFETGTAKKDYSCNASDYETPVVAMTALPSATFAMTIGGTSLENGTPTLPALTGTVEYASSIQKAHSGSKVFIVLATDGLPVGCTDNTVTTVAAEAATALSTYDIPTYVIGLGDATTNLDTIAASGGTKSAFIVSTKSPATTVSEFESAIATIQGSLGCEYPIPSPGGGQTINYSEVNVEITSSKGSQTELMYSADCSNKDGWYYDDPKAPKNIILCSGACQEAESTTDGSMDIVFGCKTNGFVP
jgi:hypothetical protein